MTELRPLAGLRKAATRRGDTLQRIAARELGDAARWYDLISINGLVWPWITDDAAQAGSTVLLAGSDILVPAPAPGASGVAPLGDDAVFGTDLLLAGGRLAAGASGDFALVSGVPNLSQATRHRVAVPERELVYHPDYGCAIHELKGARGDAVANQLGALFVERSLRRDPRISRLENTTAAINGDAMPVTTTAVTVDGRRLPLGTLG